MNPGALLLRIVLLMGLVAGCSSSEDATHALEDATPTLLWEFPVAGINAVQYDGRTAFVAMLNDGIPEINALQVETGKVLWSRLFEPYPNRMSLHGRLLAADGIVYFHHIHKEDGRATYLALDGKTGDTIWTFQLEGSGRFPRWEIVDDVLYLHAWDHYAIDPRTGELLWHLEHENIPLSVSDGIMHFFGGGEIVAVESATGSALWRHQVSGLSTTRVVGGVAYAQVGGSVRGIDAVIGEERWHREDPNRLMHFRAANDRVAILTSSMRDMSGYVVIHPSDELCAVHPRSGSSIWCKAGEPDYDSTLVFVRDDIVYLADETRLTALRASNGRRLWTREWLEGEIEGIPLVRFVDGVAYYGSINAMDPQTGQLLWHYGFEDNVYSYSIANFDNGDIITWASPRGLTAISLSASKVAADESRSTPTPDFREQCSNGIAVPNPQEKPGLVEDCAILLSSKESLVGNVGTLYAETRLNWSPHLSIAEWDGVSTKGIVNLGPLVEPTPTPFPPLPERVRALWLHGHGLVGIIPPEIGELTELDAIELDYNDLTGNIPLELGNLKDLRILSMAGNRLDGTIPPELAKLVKLLRLDLNYNQLSGTIPREMEALTRLTHIYMSNAELSGCIPQSWKDVPIQQYRNGLSPSYCR